METLVGMATVHEKKIKETFSLKLGSQSNFILSSYTNNSYDQLFKIAAIKAVR